MASVVGPAVTSTFLPVKSKRSDFSAFADDALTSTVLAATCPLFMAPAMNTHMYENPATQQNLQTLRQRGWQVETNSVAALVSTQCT